MKPVASIALLSALVMAGCSGGASQVNSGVRLPAGASLRPLSLTQTTSPAVSAATNLVTTSAKRQRQNSVSGVPTVGSTPPPLIELIIDLLDAPLTNASQVNLAVVGVNATAGNVATPVISFASPVVVNVLDYQSTALILGGAAVPAGSYSGVQLIVDPTQSSVVANGQTYPVTFGAYTRGGFVASSNAVQAINYALPFSASSGTVNLLLDFNAADSVNLTGGVAQIAPAGTGTPWQRAGAIGGTLVSSSGDPVQYATAVVADAYGNTVGVSTSDQNGNFYVHAIPAGTYTVTIENAFTNSAGSVYQASDGSTGSLAPVTVDVPAGYLVSLGQVAD